MEEGMKSEQFEPAVLAWFAIQQRGPVCRRWRSFANFYSDVGPRPSWRHLLIRDDPTGVFSPDNAHWRIAKFYRQQGRKLDAARRRRS
jgi:hypothetical protein